MYAVVMAGGSGTRLWPLSRRRTPKQLLPLTGETSLLQQTVARIAPLLAPTDIYVITGAGYVRQTVDQLMFKDPALAVWRVGDPTPSSYDELFLSETAAKGFVHLDVDKIGGGDQFVFDSGIPSVGGPSLIISPSPSAGGGSDVVQEWGVVRASL